MGRRRKRRAGRSRDADPEAILAGREDVSAEELFRLIHRVNPTGRNLEAREERRLYDQKASLQSLLVRRFSELVVVEPGGEEGVASLGHRSGSLDACHAVIDDLEPDARSWVRRQLDLGASAGAPEEPPVTVPSSGDDEPPAESTDELVARAERAVGDYEYDVAERCLVRALERSGGAPEAALPLVELRVELLGMDAEALAAEPRLNPRAREHPRIRALLALAAARLGEVERALDLVRGVPAAPAAAVHAALAHGAAGHRDLEAAERFLAETEILDPAQPRLAELRGEIAELVATNARPAEEKLAERHRREGALAAEAEARALLERWSESEVARRILQEAAEIRRRREIEDALQSAETALAEERFYDAERHFRAALEAGSDRPGLEDLAADARRRAAEHEDEDRLAAVVDAFAGDDEPAAHLAYLALPEPLRRRARREIGRPSLDWLEEAEAPPSGQRAHAAVAAVLALEGLLGRTEIDPQRIVDELAPHVKTLHGVGEARRWLEEAEENLAEERRRRAVAVLSEALRAADDGRVDELGDLLAMIESGELDDDGRAAYEELRDRQRRAEDYARLTAEHRRAVDEDDLLGARDHALELAELAEGEADLARWRREADKLRQRIRERWAVEIDAEERPLSEVRDFQAPLLYATPEAWLDDDGRELILADVKGAWLFIRVIDLQRRKVVERVSLRPPVLMAPATVWREGDVVRVVDESGGFLELARHGWEALRAVYLHGLFPVGAAVRDKIPTPGSPHLWIEVSDLRSDRLAADSSVVLDLETLRFGRRRTAAPRAVLLHPDGPRVVCRFRDEDTRIFSARGVEVPGWRLPRDLDVSPAPGSSLLTVEALERDGALLTLRRAGSEAARPEDLLRVPECRLHDGKLLATSLGEGLAFLLFRNPEGESELLAVEISDRGLEERYRMPFVWDAAFVQDRRGRHLLAVQGAGDHLRIQPLGPSEPRRSLGPSVGTVESPRVPSFEGPYPCEVGAPLDFRSALLDPSVETPEQRRRFHQRLEQDPYPFVSALLYARNHQDLPGLEEELRKVRERLPTSLAVRYALAVLATDEGRWDEVHDWLSAVDPATVGGGFRRHFHHLLGLSWLTRGRFREARESFAAGRCEKVGICRFGPLIELTEALEAGELSVRDSGVDRPLVWQLCGAIQAADRALAAGDAAAAVAALDRPAVWSAREVQSAARLAAAWLAIEPATPGQLFDKRQSLSFFHNAHTEMGRDVRELDSDFGSGVFVNLVTGSRRRSLEVPPLAWDRERLDELADEAFRWLDSQWSRD